MAYKIQIENNFFVLIDTSTSFEIIREVRDQVKFSVSTTVYKFKWNYANAPDVSKEIVTEFDFSNIVDSGGIAFASQAVLNAFLSSNIGYIGETSIISQVITNGVVDKTPSEDAVFDALALKLDINALPSNLTLYPTDVASDIATYYKMVTSLDDTDYPNPAVDFITPAITTVSQIVGSVATTVGVLSGNPGTLANVGTIGNIKRNSGSGNATFYFEVYHRNLAGTETLIGVSNQTSTVTSSSYVEFEAFVVWDNGTFLPSDRIVIKYFANRIAGGSNPVYSFQFGGATPTRTIVPVPASVLLDVPIQVGVTEIIDGTNGTLLRNESGVVGDTDYTVPKTDGTANQVLQTNGAGVVTWQTLATGITIGTTPITSGTDGRVLFQSGGVVQQDSLFVFNPTTKVFGVGVAAPNGIFNAVGGVSELRFSTGAGSTTPTLAVINTGGTGKAVALAAGTGGSVFAFDNSGFFGIVGESKATILSNSVGSGTIHFRVESGGNVGIGSSAALARLDVRAQGALSTDIALRVRNSANTANFLEINGNGTFILGEASLTRAFQYLSDGRLFMAETSGNFIELNPSTTNNRLFGGSHGWEISTASATKVIELRTATTALQVYGGSVQLATGLNATDGTNIFSIQNGTAPTGSYVDQFKVYSKDIVAGNAAPHFRTENGTIVKLYQNAAVTSVQGIADALTNLGVLASSTIAASIPTHDGPTYDTNAIQTLTAAEYAAIGTPDPATLYFII